MINVILPLIAESAFHELEITRFWAAGRQGRRSRVVGGGVLSNIRMGPHSKGSSSRRVVLASVVQNVSQLHSIEAKSETLFSF